jgi:hypothetical protein
MTPADEVTFITLWQQGAGYRELAQALGVPLGTVGSRAAALAARGAHPNQRTKARQGRSTVPVQSSAEQSGAGQSTTALVPSPTASSAAIIDLLRQTLARLDTVEHDLKALRGDRSPGSVQSSAVQSGAEQSSVEAPTLTPDDAKAERWNLWLPRGLRHRIEAIAKARGYAPSKVVQEALWQWVTTEERQ